MRGAARVIGLLVMAIAIAGCPDPDAGGGSAAGVEPWSAELPVSAPWLRERLPAGVLAYQRIPHPLGLLAMPKGNLLDSALGSEANIRNVVEIQRGLSENVLGVNSRLADPRLKLFVEDLRSPIEIAVLGLPSPSGLIAATLDVASAAELEQTIADLSTPELPLSLAAPLADDGVGRLQGLPAPAYVRFEAGSGRLLVSVGPSVTIESFRQTLARLDSGAQAAGAGGAEAGPAGAHPMHALERRIDASGYGFFTWIDTANVLPFAQMFAAPETMSSLRSAGLDRLDSVAIGAGSAGGKSRLSVLLDVGTDYEARPFPVVSNALGATSVGEPAGVFLLSLPSAEEFARLESLALEAVPDATQWLDAKSLIAEFLGVELEELFVALGPDAYVIFDEAGDYGAVRVRDVELFDDIMRRISARSGEPVVSRDVAGRTFHAWRAPSSLALAENADLGEAGEVLSLFARIRERMYWIRDGEYLYISGIPQPLLDRVRSGAGTSLAEWLETTQGADWSSSLLAVSGSIEKMPMRTYYYYIAMMQTLADLSGVEYDVWAMPTADQLGLPEAGAIGASLNLGEPYVSFELTYETQPAELLLGSGGMGTFLGVGVLAAIAIPAYQDYTVRAGVAAGLAQAHSARLRVAEHYASTGRFPNADEAAALAPAEVSAPVEAITVGPGTGNVVIYFVPGAIPGGGQVWLRPEAGPDGGLTWSCGGTIEPSRLPSSCR